MSYQIIKEWILKKYQKFSNEYQINQNIFNLLEKEKFSLLNLSIENFKLGIKSSNQTLDSCAFCLITFSESEYNQFVILNCGHFSHLDCSEKYQDCLKC